MLDKRSQRSGKSDEAGIVFEKGQEAQKIERVTENSSKSMEEGLW